MVSLTDHAFGDAVSTAAFGHSGYAGASFALADPVHDLVVAATFNGIVDHNQAFQRRTDLLRAIRCDLATWRRDALPRATAFAQPAGSMFWLSRKRLSGS